MSDKVHHDVNKQMKIGMAMHKAYFDWSQAKKSKKAPDIVQALRCEYIDLKSQMNYYEPDPAAKF